MAEDLLSRIRRRYEVEASLPGAERAAERAEAALRQAIFDRRDAVEKELAYSGSFGSLRDRLTGKKEARELELRHGVQRAESALAAARQEKDRAEQQLAEIKAQLEQLPAREALLQMARENPDTDAVCSRLEAAYCAAMLTELLEQNHRDLADCGKLLRGEYLGTFAGSEETARIEATPGVSGRECAEYLRRLRTALERLDMTLEGAPYFDDPVYYIVSAAARHNRLDRCRDALEQNEAMQRAIRRLNIGEEIR